MLSDISITFNVSQFGQMSVVTPLSNTSNCNIISRLNIIKKGAFLNKLKSTKRITKRMIYRSVASSTAIETGVAVADIERKLKNNSSKFDFLILAN